MRYKQDHPESQSKLEEAADDMEPDASSGDTSSGGSHLQLLL